MMDLARTYEIMLKATVMKKNMKKRHLYKAKAKCPFCEGHWHAYIAKYNGHMRMQCDGECGTQLME
jgi:hypothetical protein